MENIISMLQEKVGITKLQAEKAIDLLNGVFGDFTDKAENTHAKSEQRVLIKTEESEEEAENAEDHASLNNYVDKIRNMFGATEHHSSRSRKR